MSPSPTISLPAQPRRTSAGHQAQADQRRDGPRPPGPRPPGPRPPGPRPPVGHPGRPGEDLEGAARPAGQRAKLGSGQQTKRGNPVVTGGRGASKVDFSSELELKLKARLQP